LSGGSATILSGVEENEVDNVIDMTRQECRARREMVPVQNLPVLGEIGASSQPVEVRVGGATVFVVDVGASSALALGDHSVEEDPEQLRVELAAAAPRSSAPSAASILRRCGRSEVIDT
jgi:hypothetical protein